VFSSGQQSAIFYIAQSFLKYYYKTENIPYWITMGYGAYQARIRPSVEKVREAITTLGRTPFIHGNGKGSQVLFPQPDIYGNVPVCKCRYRIQLLYPWPYYG